MHSTLITILLTVIGSVAVARGSTSPSVSDGSGSGGSNDPKSLKATFLADSAPLGDITFNSALKTLDLALDSAAVLPIAEKICGDSGGEYELQWHIHDFWKHDDSTTAAVGPEACGPALTGGHWDPTLACGAASGNP